MKSKIFKILEIIFMSIMGLIILVLGIFIVQRLINKDKPVNILGFYLYEVDISGSMYNPGDPDSLAPGDLLFVRKQKEYVVGDVVTFQVEGAQNPTTHKIINIEDRTIYTQGINPNNDPDAPFDEKYIIGKVVNVWYGFGNFKKIILSPYTIIVFVLVGIGGSVLLSSLESKFSKKKEEEKKSNNCPLNEEQKEEIIIKQKDDEIKEQN